MKAAGYSGTPLAKKLGMKSGFKVRLINQPDYYFQLFTDLPEDIQLITDPAPRKNFIHYFATRLKDIQSILPLLRKEITDDGTIWISWYKKSSKIPTDITEDLIRELAFMNGLVDIKVCAIDDKWSGLKLVIPVRSRGIGQSGGTTNSL